MTESAKAKGMTREQADFEVACELGCEVARVCNRIIFTIKCEGLDISGEMAMDCAIKCVALAKGMPMLSERKLEGAAPASE